MARVSLREMSIDELLNLRDDVSKVLNRMAAELGGQLARLESGTASPKQARGGTLKGRKVPIKYRDRSGNTWAGRGAIPVWLRDRIKAGAKLEDFAVDKKAVAPKARKKPRGRRRAKR